MFLNLSIKKLNFLYKGGFMILTGNQIKQKRIQFAISQKELAKLFNLTNVYISYIESGKKEALKTRLKITEYFNKLEEIKE